MIRLVVEKVNDERPGKYGDMPVRRVIFKDIDNPKTNYYLNLDYRWPERCELWLQVLKPGNIVDCAIYSKNNLSLFVDPKLVKAVDNE